MFDPERDDDPGAWPFYRRLLVVAVISVLGCAALAPSVTAFQVRDNNGRNCLAIMNGWHADKGPPSEADAAAVIAALPPVPTPAQAADPEFMARWRVEWQAAQSNPAVVGAYARTEWINGPGACIRESRHRLVLSGIGLASLGAIVGGAALVLRTRKNLRPSPARAGA